MESKNILSIIDRINDMEKVWIIPYGIIWNYYFCLKKRFEGTKEWEKEIIKTTLPASKREIYVHSPESICSTIPKIDPILTMNHLVVMIALFQELVNETAKLIFPDLKPNKYGDVSIQDFLNKNKTKNILNKMEREQITLAKKTRDCYIHHDSKTDSRWVKSFKDIYNIAVPEEIQIQDIFQNKLGKDFFHQVEDWYELMMKISNTIRTF